MPDATKFTEAELFVAGALSTMHPFSSEHPAYALPYARKALDELDLTDDFIEGTWNAECSCGWSSGDRQLEADAIDDWENHCDVVFMESTGPRRRK